MDGEAGRQPDPAALERVRRDLAGLGADADSAPDVPPLVTSRVVAALRSQPAHSVHRPRLGRLHVVGLIVGLGAALIAAVLGAVMLSRGPAPTLSRGPTAEQITVSRPAVDIPLSDAQILGLLSRSPDYGPLADAQRRASCLDGLGYSAGVDVLGADPVEMHGRPAVMLLVPGNKPDAVVAIVVEPNCNAAHTGLLADTTVTRP
jgi:hypothetical protein